MYTEDSSSTLRDTHWCGSSEKQKALSRWFMARSKAFMNLYLRNSASARSHRLRHFSKLPPLPAGTRHTHSKGAQQFAALELDVQISLAEWTAGMCKSVGQERWGAGFSRTVLANVHVVGSVKSN